ncbi:PASTA domain-containing protein [Marinilabiliaceae bacterium JC017]|nr:PASTA domain-containing protein [Marinilabiliaceae bacterium JC017]
MSIIRFFVSKTFIKNFGIVLGVAILLLISLFIGLSVYTNHGESYAVPDFSGLTESQFSELVSQKEFRYKIIDSVHITEFLPGVVVEQTPHAGERVKKNRTIFFTINGLAPEKVQVPRLIDYSLRNAKAILESYGLKTGELIYIPSEYTNLVLGQHFEGKPVEAGASVVKGSEIDLLIGKGLSQEKTNVPDLFGLSFDEAMQVCQSVSLNIGASIYDESIENADDTVLAFIWKQSPASEEGKRLRLGASMDVWLTLDSTKILPDTLVVGGGEEIMIDSLKTE